MKILENRLVLLFFFIILILIIIYLISNQKMSKNLFNIKKLRKKIVESFTSSESSDELITNGNFSGGQNIDQFSTENGVNVIKKVNNPGDSDYVLMQKQSGYNTFYKIMVTPEKNQQYSLSLWVRFDNPTSSYINFKELVKINTQNNNSINDIVDINYTVPSKVTLSDDKIWYNVLYNFTTSNSTMVLMNVYLNYTTDLQAQYIYFADVSLKKVLTSLPTYSILNGLKVFLSGINYQTSSMGKTWANLVDSDDFFTWSNLPLTSETGGYLSTDNNSLTYLNPLDVLEVNQVAQFSISLVFNKDMNSNSIQENTIEENSYYTGEEESLNSTPNALSIYGNDGKSLELFIPNGEGKISVVYNGVQTGISSRDLVFYNKTILTLTYSNNLVNVYQDGISVLSMSTGTVHLDSNPLIINKNGNWDVNLYDVIIYNRVLTMDEMQTMNDYFYNESDNVSSFFVSNGESIADSEGLFELDMDNYNLISYGEELSETDYQKDVCYSDCDSLCNKFINTSSVLSTGVDDFNKCKRSCKNTVKSCQTFCSNSPNDRLCELTNCNTDENIEYVQSDCPIVYKKNGLYKVYIQSNTPYSDQLGYSGERCYGSDRANALSMYTQNFPNCDTPDILKVGCGKNLMETCPFIINENNPCYTSACDNVDWSDENSYPGLSSKCKINVNSYCQANRNLDSKCACWKEENRTDSECADFRRNFAVNGVNTGTPGDFPITQHPDFKKYIRKDNIPCWNCNIP